jgi:hypothetical protein
VYYILRVMKIHLVKFCRYILRLYVILEIKAQKRASDLVILFAIRTGMHACMSQNCGPPRLVIQDLVFFVPKNMSHHSGASIAISKCELHPTQYTRENFKDLESAPKLAVRERLTWCKHQMISCKRHQNLRRERRKERKKER